MSFRPILSAVWISCALQLCLCTSGLGQASKAEAAQSSVNTIYLRTERIPYKHRVEKGYQYLMMRELARQGFVITANLDFGLTVRDETLGESLPANGQSAPLVLTERADSDGDWHLKLYRVKMSDGITPAVDELWPTSPLWQATVQYETSIREMYAFAAGIFDLASFDEFNSALQAAGFSADGQKQQFESADALPTQRWEKALLRVDYVVQYGVVREVHQALERHGETPELLAILSRAYANLALLTDHHSNAACRAFAARALILSARSARKFSCDDAMRLNQIYVWAMVGQHHTASHYEGYLSKPLKEFEDVQPWVGFVHAYLQSDLENMHGLAIVKSDIQPWSARLWMEMIKAYRYEQWLQEAMHLMPQIAPTAYGAYAFLAARGDSLGVTRWAASSGPIEFANRLPQSIERLVGLPNSVATQLTTTGAQRFLGGFFSNYNELFSEVPSKLATALRDVSNSDPLTAISWSALAFLIEEEQFAQASNFLKVSTNAVESSLDAEVDAVLKHNYGHRYAHWLRSYYHRHPTALGDKWQLQTELELVDPRGNMLDMLADVNYATRQLTPTEYVFDPWILPQADFTLQGIIDSSILGGWTRARMSAEKMQLLVDQFGVVVPNSELNVRFEIQTTAVEDDKQLIMWEQRLRRDRTSFMLLADHYWRLYDKNKMEGYLDQAIRCLTKSQEILISDDATRRLAAVYYEREEFEKWEQTHLDFLESDFPDQGLTRASISVLLANGLMGLERWRDAKPHAVNAGNTYSAWGLQCASQACEGLAEWKESENYISEMSRNYPSESGFRWYYWCRRTGRGDIVAARALAQPYFEATARSLSRGHLYDQGTFRMLEGDQQSAKLAFSNLFSTTKRPEYALIVFQLTRDLESNAAAMRLAARMEALFPDPEARDDVAHEAVKIFELLKQGSAVHEEFQERINAVLELPEYSRGRLLYVLAKEMHGNGHEEAAAKTYRLAMMHLNEDEPMATLAGAELAKHLGTSREDDESWDNVF